MSRCKNAYRLPVNKKEIIRWNKKKSPAHKGKLRHSLDFIVSEGTPIYAAASGKVVFVKQYSKVGGPHKKYWFQGNRIVIKHKNWEYTAYEHLKYRGAKVKVGQIVRNGQFIGYSGNTGYSYEPHLHFEVFNNPSRDESEGTTIQVSFKELKK